MSDKEKDIIKKISLTVPKLDREKQNYVLGVMEGIILARDMKESDTRELQEV